MGLRDVIQRATVTAFAAIGDIPVDCEYRSVESREYNPTTGEEEEVFLTYSPTQVVFTDYTEMEVDGEKILSSDKKGLMAARGLGFTPKDNDRLAPLLTHEIWHVLGWDTDPVTALYTLHLRRL